MCENIETRVYRRGLRERGVSMLVEKKNREVRIPRTHQRTSTIGDLKKWKTTHGIVEKVVETSKQYLGSRT